MPGAREKVEAMAATEPLVSITLAAHASHSLGKPGATGSGDDRPDFHDVRTDDPADRLVDKADDHCVRLDGEVDGADVHRLRCRARRLVSPSSAISQSPP